MIGLPHQSAVTLAGAIHETAMRRYRAELTATPGDLLAALIYELAVVIVAVERPPALGVTLDTALDELARTVAILQMRNPGKFDA